LDHGRRGVAAEPALSFGRALPLATTFALQTAIRELVRTHSRRLAPMGLPVAAELCSSGGRQNSISGSTVSQEPHCAFILTR
jgi:hypothetical protein